MRPFVRLAAALAIAAAAAVAHAESLIVSLSSHRISITSTYSGAEIAVFGAIERDARTVARASGYDLAITVRGPLGTVVVREKGAVGFIWINRSQRRYANAPTYVATLSSRPVEEFATPDLQRRLEIGLAAFLPPGGTGGRLDTRDASFRTALARLKEGEGLYRTFPKAVTFLNPTIFQAPIRVPPNAPTGNYTVDVALFADGAVLARHRTNFEVVKAGFESFVAESAREKSWSYGVAAASIALMFGWLASVAFRRD